MHQIDLKSSDSVQAWLAHWMTSELSLDDTGIDPDRAFLSYGMDSMHAMMLVGDLEGSIGTRLPPTLAWDYPTVRALAEHVVAKAASLSASQDPVPETTFTQVKSGGEPDARAILSRLDGISEEELDSLLLEYLNTSPQPEHTEKLAVDSRPPGA